MYLHIKNQLFQGINLAFRKLQQAFPDLDSIQQVIH